MADLEEYESIDNFITSFLEFKKKQIINDSKCNQKIMERLNSFDEKLLKLEESLANLTKLINSESTPREATENILRRPPQAAAQKIEKAAEMPQAAAQKIEKAAAQKIEKLESAQDNFLKQLNAINSCK